jgi:quinol-cytochrome oxidoreductase complex cytochrome b subunit
VRDAILTWTMGAATVLGVLTIAAATLPAMLGEPADPLRTPSPLRPSWPLFAWYAAVDRSPSWVPVPLLFLLAALLLFFWPDVARPLATKRPLVHTALGAVALLVAAALTALEILR